MIQTRTIVIIGIVAIAALFRFLPTPPNVAPVAAMALFGGALFADKRLALLLPLAVMFITDLFLGLHSTLWAVYLSFAAIAGIGILVGKNRNVASITAGAISGSVLFFVITNFAVWLMGSGMFYPKTIEGLMMCYTAAIPFFHNTLVGDLFFTGALFGSYELLRRYVPSLRAQLS
jgi:hypothetical protein